MIPPAALRAWALKASLGVFFPDRDGANQYLSLQNKFLDNIESGLPQITCSYPEYELINAKYPVALLLEDATPTNIANAVNMLMQDSKKRAEMTEACQRARLEYCWQEEENHLLSIYENYVGR
jgi:hypothetical protein